MCLKGDGLYNLMCNMPRVFFHDIALIIYPKVEPFTDEMN